MAYNMNTDYMAIMNANPKGSAEYKAAEASRNEKIAAMNKAGTNTSGYTQTNNGVAVTSTPTYTAPVQQQQTSTQVTTPTITPTTPTQTISAPTTPTTNITPTPTPTPTTNLTQTITQTPKPTNTTVTPTTTVTPVPTVTPTPTTTATITPSVTTPAPQTQKYDITTDPAYTALLNKYNTLEKTVNDSQATAKAQSEADAKTKSDIIARLQSYSAPDNTSLINSLIDAQEKTRLAQLETSRNNSLTNLNTEKAAISPTYYDKRNQQAALSQQQARNFAEFMAARGGANSGVSAQAEIARNSALQGSIGNLNRDEAQAFTDIENRRSQINQNAINETATIQSDLQAQKQQQLLNDAYNRQEAALQIAALTGFLGGMPTLAKQTLDYNASQDALDRTDKRYDAQGKVINPDDNTVVNTSAQNEINRNNTLEDQDRAKADFEKTITQYANDYQAQINKVLGDNDPSNDWQADLLKVYRQAKIDKAFEEDVKTLGQYANDYQAEISRREKTPSTEDDKLIPYLKMARIEKLAAQDTAKAQAAQQEFENYIKSKGLELDAIKTNYEVNRPYFSPNSGGSGASSGSGSANTKSGYFSTVKSAVDSYIKSLSNQKAYDGKTPLSDYIFKKGSAENIKVYNMIVNSPMSDDEQQSMLDMYGIPYDYETN